MYRRGVIGMAVVEVLDCREGLWCRDCALPSGARITLAFSGALPPGVSAVTRCRQCGGDAIEPEGA